MSPENSHYLVPKDLNLETASQKLLNVLSFPEYLLLLLFYRKNFSKQIFIKYFKLIIKISFLSKC